jgi:hypothetical protein
VAAGKTKKGITDIRREEKKVGHLKEKEIAR